MNVQKYTKNQSKQILKHCNRSDPNRKYGNTEIDKSRTNMNYNLAPEHEQSDYQYMVDRCQDLKIMNRNDVNYMADWVVTVPKDYTGDVKQFFQESYNFLSNRYGANNVISSYVHMDETTPHMHFCFVPTIEKENKNGEIVEKVNAKTCLSKTELSKIHPVIQEYLSEKLGQEVHILNGVTEGGNLEINKLKNQTLEDKIKIKEDELELNIEANNIVTTDTATKQEQLQRLEVEVELKKEEAFKDIKEDLKKEIGKNKIKQEMIPQPKATVEEKGFGKNKKEVVDKKDYDNLEDLRKLEQQNNQLYQDQVNTYKLELKEKDKKIKELKEKDNIKKYEELEEKYSNFEKENKDLKEELKQSKQQQQQAEQDLQKYQEKNKNLNEENEALEEENKTLKNKLQKMSETIKSGWNRATTLLKLISKSLSKLLQIFPQLRQKSEIQKIDKGFTEFGNNEDVQILNQVTNNNQQQQTQTKSEDTEEQ